MRLLALLAVAGLAACSDVAKLPPTAATGPDPQLPAPVERPIPTVHIAPAKGWPEGAKPRGAPGMKVEPFANVRIAHATSVPHRPEKTGAPRSPTRAGAARGPPAFASPPS